jgi:hypothetical protein
VLAEVADQLQPAVNPNAQSAEVGTASAAIATSPLSVVIDTSASSPSPASPETQNSAHSSSTYPLSSLGNTPAHSPISDTSISSCVLDECQSTALSHTSEASAETIARLEPDAVGASSCTSNGLRSCPKLSYASPDLRTDSIRPSTRYQSTRPNKTAETSKPGCEPTTSCSYSDKVAPHFLSVVERKEKTNATEDLEIVMKYEAQQELLCLKHLQMYAKWATTSVLCHQKSEDTMCMRTPKRPTSDLFDPLPFAATKRRHLSLPEAGSEFNRLSEGAVQNPGIIFLPVAEESKDPRPVHYVKGDARFQQRVMAQLERKVVPKKSPKTWRELNNQVMCSLLSRASQPTTISDESEEEVYYMTGEEAKTRLESHIALHGPIITEDQQQFRWDHWKGRPIEQLFRRIGNPTRSVSVQKPSLSLRKPSFELMRLGEVQAVFAENVTSDDPLNVLDLRNPLPRSVLSYFLTGEDCQLLSRVRDVLLEGASAERCTAPIVEWNKWKDDEDWVLLAQGGAHTLTHQDSCGKAKWLTVQGQLGFVWISHPSKEETRSWSVDPNGFTGGQLRARSTSCFNWSSIRHC